MSASSSRTRRHATGVVPPIAAVAAMDVIGRTIATRGWALALAPPSRDRSPTERANANSRRMASIAATIANAIAVAPASGREP